jgi:hypothetical protein
MNMEWQFWLGFSSGLIAALVTNLIVSALREFIKETRHATQRERADEQRLLAKSQVPRKAQPLPRSNHCLGIPGHSSFPFNPSPCLNWEECSKVMTIG